PVVVWTMEMAAPVLAARMATQESGDYYLDVLRDRDLQDRVSPSIPANVYYYSGKDIGLVIKSVKRVMRLHEGRPPLLIVDYMQKAPSKADDPRQKLTEVSESLRTLALKLECPLLAISSASREGARKLRES